MSAYYDDNFGFYNTEDDHYEAVSFYRENQRRSVLKTCVCCGRKVKLLPQYNKCNSCCERIESGWQY